MKTCTPTYRDGAELLTSYPEPKPRCHLDGYQNIVFDAEPRYYVHLAGCNTPKRLLSWCMHLCEKTWMDTATLRDFIILAHTANGKPVPW
ncbi:MAG: hypothetical protein IMZ62_12760 [Chloroflexi bacterium]|nr:hypothetical protein [Chloroflexota bacterium]MBE3117509.1 hypothetical protein [Candidatus Atribacteria bacterium]